MRTYLKQILSILSRIEQNIEKLVKANQKPNYYTETPYRVKPPAIKPEQNPVKKYNNYFSQRHVTTQEWEALDDLYICLVDKGSHPEHSEHLMREIENKWPLLYLNLNKVIKAKEASNNKYDTNYNYSSIRYYYGN